MPNSEYSQQGQLSIYYNMKRIFILSLLVTICTFINLISIAQSLKVHESQRYLVKTDGKAFMWIGDTAWELFHKLNREEATEYLENRAAKGFTIIQAVVLAENDGLRSPNPYGEVPLIDLDPIKPNEAYFEHVDFIVNKAEELGLFIGMLPTWGDKVFSKYPGKGPIVFNQDNAMAFGEYLGKRYKDKSIVWILGGDRNVANDEVLGIWQNMARGLKKGDNENHLITYHPRGNSSSSYFLHNEEWLDFNMYQSGHAKRFNKVYDYATHDMLLQPRKPFLDGEPAYEDIAVKFWDYEISEGDLDEKGLIKNREIFSEGFFTDYDVRIHAYWDFLAGACGYTYGNNAIWQMYKPNGNMAIPCLYDWHESLDRPGAADMEHVHKIFKIRPFEKLIPDQSIVYGYNANNENHIQAAIANDKSFMLIYLAKGQKVTVNMKKLNNSIEASWYNPRDGNSIKIGEYKNDGKQEFTPPGSGENNDWLLVLDDMKANNLKLE